MQICTLTDENNLLNRDWAVVRCFLTGVSENIRYTLDLDFFESLQHTRYNCLKVLPQEYITNLKTKHCPLDVNKIAELKTHYNRGLESNKNLRRLPKQLNKEEASIHIDGLTNNKDDKFSHYLRKLHQSGTFTDETAIKRNNNLTADQTYTNAIIFFEKKKDGMDKVWRLTGNTKSCKKGFSSANTAI